jgi:hypothetical protein
LTPDVAGLAVADSRGESLTLESLGIVLARARREVFYLWRYALSDNDAELSDRLSAIGHALNTATAMLNREDLLPSQVKG